MDIRRYLHNEKLIFNVSKVNQLKAFPKFNEITAVKSDNLAMMASIVIVSIGFCVSVAAFIVNQAPCLKGTDNSRFMVPLLVALGVYDFISDINLSLQIFRHEQTEFGYK